MYTVARQLGSILAKWKHTCLLPLNTGGKLIMARVESTTPNILGANAMRKRHWMQFCLLCCQVFSTCRSPVVSVVRQHDAICAKPDSALCIIVSINTIYCEYGACWYYSHSPPRCPRAARGWLAGAPLPIPHQPAQPHVRCHSSTITMHADR